MSLNFKTLKYRLNQILIQVHTYLSITSKFLLCKIIISVFIILPTLIVNGQNLSNLREIQISTKEDTIIIDTLPIIPNSIWVKNKLGYAVNEQYYQVNELESLFIWKKQINLDSVKVAYRVYPFNFFEQQSHKNVELLNKADEVVFGKNIYSYDINKTPIDVFDLGDLNYYGNFSRGISVGSNQDLVVNSQFNLQMQGKLKNDIMVRAAITDNNIPFQAQGNTQQLQEFDRVFIELSKDNTSVILGDYELLRPNSYFMNFRKRLQGIKAQTSSKIYGGNLKATAAAAVARGEYNRMQFDGEEGNQGPYKLIGRNGENFIIILSGSERVYIDGEQLVRGFNQDYVIDYNLGELTFTANRLITKDVRIVIEFEYSIQNYLRSLVFAETSFKKDKLQFHAHLYSEQDAKNQPLNQELSSEKISFLNTVGDDINNALFSGVDTVEFTENRVLYQKIDSLVNGVNYTVYEFSQNAESAIYALSFSNVGSGNGNYIFSEAGINGRVYQWVAPDEAGTLQGNYEPVIQLITPQKRQLLTTGVAYELKNKGILSAEIGISNKDVNTFSELEDKDDVGLSANLQFQRTFKLDTTANWLLESKANYEFVQAKFEFLENYRPIEFTRNWNTSTTDLRFNEHLTSVSVALKKNRLGTLSYAINSLIQEGNYEGFRHIAENSLNYKGFTTFLRADYLHATAETENTTFFRPIIRFKYQSEKTKQWAFGYTAFQEKRKVTPYLANAGATDTLSNASLYFNQQNFFIESSQAKPNKIALNWQQRWDYSPVGNDFEIASQANTFNISGELSKNPKSQLRWNMSYRQLNVVNESLTTEKTQATTLGEVNYLFEAFKGLLRSNTNYKIGSGQKQVIEYEFTAVNNSLGTHVWQDLNDNGIKEIDEFRVIFENEFPDTTYIQITLPSNIYQRTNIVEFTENLNIIPKRLWFNKEENSFLRFLNLWEVQSQVEIARHFPADTLENNEVNTGVLYNPFLWRVAENTRELIVSEKVANRSSLFYNRGGRPINGELFYSRNNNKDILVNGTIERRLSEQGIELKSIFSKSFSGSLMLKNGNNFYASAANENNNYDINFVEFYPKLKWQNGTKLGVELGYIFKNSENENAISGTQQEVATKFRYNLAQKSAFDGRFSFIQMKYSGVLGANFNLENQILQGLTVGSNYVWNLNFRTQVSKHIELRINYNGKKSEAQKLQNTGRVQVTALF